MLLTRRDIADVAAALGCEEAALKAVVEVEAAGKGFDPKGRPVILFEPHIFERELNKRGFPDEGEHVQWARAQGVASPKWDRTLYPRDFDGRWRQVEIASQICRESALRSASWGLPQIMGFNHRLAGFATITDFVDAVSQTEGNQVAAMARFIQSSHLDDELRRRDWVGFARGYNGPGFAQNRYDEKLRKAYEKHARDPEAFWMGKANGGWGPAAGQEGLDV